MHPPKNRLKSEGEHARGIFLLYVSLPSSNEQPGACFSRIFFGRDQPV
jgi:hypothetical protein